MRIADLPEKMRAHLVPELLEYYGEVPEEISDFAAVNLEYGGNILIPNHNHDLRESTISVVMVDNLRQMSRVSLLNGPFCDIYEKTVPAAPAYALFKREHDYKHFVARF